MKQFLVYKNDFVPDLMQCDVTLVPLKMMTPMVYNDHANFSQIILVLLQFLCGDSNLA